MKKSCIVALILSIDSHIMFSQNIGIGTNSPTEKLHVTGNIKGDTIKSNGLKIAPNAGIGKVLTSDATGNANWQSSSTTTAGGNSGFGVWGDCATNGNISEYNPVMDTASAPGDLFGTAVSLSGNFAIIGAFNDDIGSNIDQGSASIYQFDGSNWVFMQKLIDVSGNANDIFGISVSVSGNFAIVGVPGDDLSINTDQGSAFIYRYNGSSWIFMQQITDAFGSAGDYFGYSVSISGNYAVVSSPADDVAGNVDQGSVSFYRYNGSTWVLMQKLNDATGAASDRFGVSVSISGNYAIVGAPYDDNLFNTDQGSVSIYQTNGTNWVLMEKLFEAEGAAADVYGMSVSISGSYAIVGIEEDYINGHQYQGSAIIYHYNGSLWEYQQLINDPAGAYNDQFGYGVSISGNYALVGAQGDDNNSVSNTGAATIFIRIGNTWQKLQTVIDPMGGGYFGVSTSIDATTKRFVAGANGFLNGRGKAIFGKVN